MNKITFRWMGCVSFLAVLMTGCLNSSSSVTSGPSIYVLQVKSVNPINATIPAISPADNNGVSSGQIGLDLDYNIGTTVTLTAATSSTSGAFYDWLGCDSTSGLTCTVKMSADRSITVEYAGVSGITLTPTASTISVPATVQFTGVATGLGTCTILLTGATTPCAGSPITFSLGLPNGSVFTGSNYGTITQPSATDAGGLYTTPYPAPASVVVTAQSAVNPSVSIFTTVTILPNAVAAGPALTVDVGAVTHPISPEIYGMNDYSLNSSVPALVNLPIERWGGDSTTRYNYQVDASNSAADYFFENSFPSSSGYPVISQFDSQVMQDELTSTKTLATVPLIGYTTKRITACSYSVKKYGQQTAVDPNNADCGTGLLGPLGGAPTGTVTNDPTDTSETIDQTFVSGWVKFLDGQFGTAATGGVAVYGLDNEPEYWNGVHKDVHPNPFTYDELSQKGITYAAAIKAQDPTALVTGPVISNWDNYFYSALDVADGYAASPSCPTGNPADRVAHGNIPFIEYYLQQFQNYETTNGTRLLDYVDLHTYFAAPGAAFALTGNTTLQQARLNSTRVFWDSTYTDPNYDDPTVKCSTTPYPPNLINLMKGWVSRDYPGTKLAITEYNWGGQEAINGALAQADILGIFGREGLDIGTLWGPPDPDPNGSAPAQVPGLVGFQVYTNYDGQNSHFGDNAVTSTSANQGLLSVYGATRTVDGMLTVVVINKGYGDLTSTLSLPNLTTKSQATVYLYSQADLASLTPFGSVPVTAASGGSTLSTTFPAQSITLLIIPTK